GIDQHPPRGQRRRARRAVADRLPRTSSRSADSRQNRGGEVMKSRLMQWCSLVLIAAAATGCTSATARFYTLDSTAKVTNMSPSHYAVNIASVTVPASVDRPQIVVQVAPNRVDLDEFNRWAAPLGDGIARAVAGDLAVLLGTSEVSVAPVANRIP